MMASPLIPPHKDPRDRTCFPPFKKGDTVYLVAKKWMDLYDAWKYRLASEPGPIDNSPLVSIKKSLKLQETMPELGEESFHVCKSLLYRSDIDNTSSASYKVICKEQWELFHDWFGGGPALPRKIINKPECDADAYIEIWPPELTFVKRKDASYLEEFTLICSCKDLISDVKKIACDRLSLSISGVEMRDVSDFYVPIPLERCDRPNDTLEKRGVLGQRRILLKEDKKHLKALCAASRDRTSFIGQLPRELVIFYLVTVYWRSSSASQINSVFGYGKSKT